MNTFLWVFVILGVVDMLGRAAAIAKRELPKRTWGTYAVDMAANWALTTWAIVMLVGDRV